MQEFTLDSQNWEMAQAFDIIENTKESLFLTGKAGSGKTTFLKWLIETTKKNILIAAPTGIAAINVGGQTIHSLFGLGISLYTPTKYDDGSYQVSKINPSRKYSNRRLFEAADVLIIDEVSMVRADLMDEISDSLAHFRKNTLPFGGVQLLMVGDLFQLPPVLTSNEKSFYDMYYDTEFFFSSIALKTMGFRSIQLKKIYRQSDNVFVGILNNIRLGMYKQTELNLLNTRFFPRRPDEVFSSTETILCSRREEATNNNKIGLDNLPGQIMRFTANVDGNFPDSKIPCEKNLDLKIGARVMITENNRTLGYQNGSVGTVKELNQGVIKITLENGNDVEITRKTYENIEYSCSNKVIIKNIVGTCDQFPIRLAYSITIHKSQGLTFDKITIDPGRIFSEGQLYVALSRARSLCGIRLLNPIYPRQVIVNNKVLDFYIKVFGIDDTLDSSI